MKSLSTIVSILSLLMGATVSADPSGGEETRTTWQDKFESIYTKQNLTKWEKAINKTNPKEPVNLEKGKLRLKSLLAGMSQQDRAEMLNDLTAADEEAKLDRLIVAAAVENQKGHISRGFNEWVKNIHHAEAVLFDFSKAEDRFLVENGQLHPGLVSGSSVRLTPSQLTHIEGLVTGDNGVSLPSKCYEPHHGIIFYNKAGRIVGHVEICFMCNNGHCMPPKGLSTHWDIDGLEKFFSKLKFPVFAKREEWDLYFKRQKAEQDAIAKPVPTSESRTNK